MGVFRIEGEKLKNIGLFFDGWEETLIWSCLHEYMGSAWADSVDKPSSAQIVTADFCFFAGEPNEELVRNKPAEYKSDFVIMVPQSDKWAALIESIYGENARKVTRYAIKKEKNIFDTEKLKALAASASGEYDIKRIDEETYKLALENSWSKDLCSQFKDYGHFSEKGLGYAAFYNGELVSGASSYTVYSEGIEIEIDTRHDHRRKGLACACGASLILECLARGLYPSWDAQNKTSVALAEKLGYHFEKEYHAYEVNSFGVAQIRDYFIQTDRISYSRWTDKDIGLANLLWGDKDVTKYICATGEFTNDDISNRLNIEIGNGREFGVQYWPIFEKKSGELIGCCGARPFNSEPNSYEIGVHLRRKYWGLGYATEAAQATIDYCFAELGAEKLFAGHHPQNSGSRKMLTKLGFQYIGDNFYEPTGRFHPSYVIEKQ